MTYDLVIKGGTLVTAADTFSADLAILGEQIAAVGENLEGHEMIDATGKLVLPGAIDPHVHLNMPTGVTYSSDDWRSGTIAAACGGTTTVIDFVEPEDGETLHEAYVKRCKEAQAGAVIDFGLHMTLTNDRSETLAEIPQIVQAGLTSFKTYTTYQGFKLTDEQFLPVLAAVGQAGGLVITHCENDAIVAFHTDACLRAGDHTPAAHPQSRPAVAEGEAVQRILALAASAGTPVYIVHVSSAPGAEAVTRARQQGQTAFGETCPQYLTLTAAEYERPGFEGAKFVCQPPLRSQADQIRLWQGLAQNHLQTVGTDHCPFNFVGQKDIGRDSFVDIPGGLPGIEARLVLVYSCGVQAGYFDLNRWVEVCCTNPARIFGLYPRKGTLIPGADADIVLFDPDKQVTVTHDVLHENVDYTPYEGFELTGWPLLTLVRGTVVARDGEFVGPPQHGRFLQRQPFTYHALQEQV